MSHNPEVLWAQRSDKVYLTVALPDAKDISVKLTAQGKHFEFSLELYGKIVPLFSIKMMDGIIATSYAPGDKFFIDPGKLLPLSRFLPQPKGQSAGGHGRGRGGGGRGPPRGRGGGFPTRGGGRGAFRGRGRGY